VRAAIRLIMSADSPAEPSLESLIKQKHPWSTVFAANLPTYSQVQDSQVDSVVESEVRLVL